MKSETMKKEFVLDSADPEYWAGVKKQADALTRDVVEAVKRSRKNGIEPFRLSLDGGKTWLNHLQ